GTQDLHPRLHRLRGHQHLGDEELARAKVLADHVHAGDEPLGEGVVRREPAAEELVDTRDDGLDVASVEVVLDLLEEFLERQLSGVAVPGPTFFGGSSACGARRKLRGRRWSNSPSRAARTGRL